MNASVYERKLYPSPNPHIRLEEITYWSDGLLVKGLLAMPKAEGSYEGIIYLRGGMQHIGMVRPARIAQFASQGFIVFAPYYRGNRGGQGKDEFAGQDRLDVLTAIDLLKREKSVKHQRIHLFSFSRGGIMAIWAAVLRDDLTSVVNWAGVSDVVLTYNERKDMRRMMKRVIGGTPNNAPTEYRDRSALFHIDKVSAPFLIIHGMRDVHVSFEHAKLLEQALLAEQKSVETWYFEQYHHYIPPVQNIQLVRELCEWMKQQ